MDLFNPYDAGLDTLRYPIMCPNCGMPDCICGTQLSSPSTAEFNNCSPATLPWTDHPTSLDGHQSIFQNPAMPPPSSHPASAFVESQTSAGLLENSAQRSDCSCLREVLLISERLERYAGCKLGFKSLVVLSRNVLEACEKYPRCQNCEEFLITTLCITALRRTSAFYRELASAPQGGSALDERTFQCRIGNFESEAVLDEDTCRLLLCAEIKRSLRSTAEFERLVGPESKEARRTDNFALQYYQDMIKNVKTHLQEALDLMHVKNG